MSSYDNEDQENRFFSLSIDMLCVAGFDGYFKKVNPAFERTLGWNECELMDRPFFDLVHPDDGQATRETLSSLMEGNDLFRFENRYRCKSGSFKWIAWSAFPVVDESVIYAIGRDITKRKELEASLRESERKYRNLLEDRH